MGCASDLKRFDNANGARDGDISSPSSSAPAVAAAATAIAYGVRLRFAFTSDAKAEARARDKANADGEDDLEQRWGNVGEARSPPLVLRCGSL